MPFAKDNDGLGWGLAKLCGFSGRLFIFEEVFVIKFLLMSF